jgi:hypothetical protein
MIRTTLIVASVSILLGLIWMTARWARLNFVPSPTPIEIPAEAFVRHAGYGELATKAIDAFDALPAHRRQALVENLRANLGDLARELERLNASRFAILCIGERHMATTRRFLAEVALPALAIDVLLLETPGDALPEIMRQIDAGLARVDLLDADIAAMVRSARATNPAIVIAGIDETATQKAQRTHRKQGSRDISIAGNLRSHIRRGKRHAVLFGALHCADQPNWMYRRVRLGEHRVKREEIRNVNVIGEHQDGPVEALLVFLHAIGIEGRNFLIADTGALDELIYAWFPALTRSFLRFDAVIVFQEHPHSHSRAAPGRLE